MKKILILLIFLSLIITPSFAMEIFVSNLPSSKYGGCLFCLLIPDGGVFYGLSGYYEVGLPIKEVKGLYLMAGPKVTYIISNYISNFRPESEVTIDTSEPLHELYLEFKIEGIYFIEKWSFTLFNLKFYPAIKVFLNIFLLRYCDGHYSPTGYPYAALIPHVGLYIPYKYDKNTYFSVNLFPSFLIGFNMVRF
jgi:hypothetical protein